MKIVGERMQSLRESVRRCHGFCHRIPCCGCAAKKKTEQGEPCSGVVAAM